MNSVWDSIKITPVNPSIVYSLRNKSFLTRKMAGFAVKYIIKKTYSKITVNPRFFENTFVLNIMNTRLNKGSKILDIGSAESDLPLYLHASGFAVIPFDQRNYPFLPSVRGDAIRLHDYFEPASFDAISVISTIEHIGLGSYGDHKSPVSYSYLIDQWKILLKPGGYMVMTLPVTSRDTRKEQGQWVKNIQETKKIMHNSRGKIISEKLVVENSGLSCAWEEISVDQPFEFITGVYMCAIQYHSEHRKK